MTQPLPPLPPVVPEPTARRRRRPSRNQLIAGGAVAVLVVGGVTWGIVASRDQSVTAGAGTAAPSVTNSPPVPGSTSPSSPARTGAGRATRGQVTAESGSTWTIRTRKGQSVTVVITDNTAFGTKKRPLTAAQIVPGAGVLVTGTDVNGTVTATRVTTVAAAQPTASPS